MVEPLKILGTPVQIETSFASVVAGVTNPGLNNFSSYNSSQGLQAQVGVEMAIAPPVSLLLGLNYRFNQTTGRQILPSALREQGTYALQSHFFGVATRVRVSVLPERFSFFGALNLGLPHQQLQLNSPSLGTHQVQGIEPVIGIGWEAGMELSGSFNSGRFNTGLAIFYQGEQSSSLVKGDPAFAVAPPASVFLQSHTHSLMVALRLRFR